MPASIHDSLSSFPHFLRTDGIHVLRRKPIERSDEIQRHNEAATSRPSAHSRSPSATLSHDLFVIFSNCETDRFVEKVYSG